MTQTELELELLKSYGDIWDSEIDSKEETHIFEKMSEIDGIIDFFRKTAMNDIKRYFAATDEKGRDLARGAFLRAIYMKAHIADPSKIKDRLPK